MILELPPSEDVQNYAGIEMWIAPPSACATTFDMDNLPTSEQLSDIGWKKPLWVAHRREMSMQEVE